MTLQPSGLRRWGKRLGEAIPRPVSHLGWRIFDETAARYGSHKDCGDNWEQFTAIEIVAGVPRVVGFMAYRGVLHYSALQPTAMGMARVRVHGLQV
jgi:hypothetical protein